MDAAILGGKAAGGSMETRFPECSLGIFRGLRLIATQALRVHVLGVEQRQKTEAFFSRTLRVPKS